ncbi:hypothetical protein [Hymenobacter lapidiphilus]|uniref:DUF5004 domain-containing protein n=1 Tax=Hymenobacter lapidiphilus TaxID=2608003 RepID=A0A7Y7U7J3_9BACT|nr:hypothetical protein [Hymenobacter lapidiphilus]NVO32580.1 hypothetical protein [Hymenobacter lapidiphilus]
MKRVPMFLSLAAIACSLFSCNKDLEEVSPMAVESVAVSRPLQLASSNWHQTGLLVSTSTADKVTEADLFSHVSPSMLDQLADFQADGTYTVHKGGAHSTPAVGRWLLNPAGDSIKLTLSERVRNLAVTELTADKLSLSYTDAATNGSVTTYTSVYSH